MWKAEQYEVKKIKYSSSYFKYHIFAFSPGWEYFSVIGLENGWSNPRCLKVGWHEGS